MRRTDNEVQVDDRDLNALFESEAFAKQRFN